MKEYIKREAAVDALVPICKSASFRNRNVLSTARKCLEAIEAIPAADVVEARHGRWVRPLSPYAWYKCSCELCGYVAPDSGWTAEAWKMDWYEEQIKKFVEAHPFCTRCGAKMTEV